MINHVNSVFVCNDKAATLAVKTDLEGFATKAEAEALKGKLIMFDVDKNDTTIDATTRRFKIGSFDGTYSQIVKGDDATVKFVPNVRWSNLIQAKDIMTVSQLTYKENTQDEVSIDFTGLMAKAPFNGGNVSVTLRIQYKDMPTRYRQWSESYNYLIGGDESDEDVAKKFAAMINKEHKRQRVYASAEAGKLTLKGMEYDDPKIYDQGYDNMVRFNAVIYYANPQADGITFHNKYELPVVIEKKAGERYAADSVIVRTREIEAWDYMGVLHRDKWYDPTPVVMSNLSVNYDALTIEFENEYHAADDIRRHTKESVEIYMQTGGTVLNGIKAAVEAAAGQTSAE